MGKFTGSSPVGTIDSPVTQRLECFVYTEEVGGSNPFGTTLDPNEVRLSVDWVQTFRSAPLVILFQWSLHLAQEPDPAVDGRRHSQPGNTIEEEEVFSFFSILRCYLIDLW